MVNNRKGLVVGYLGMTEDEMDDYAAEHFDVEKIAAALGIVDAYIESHLEKTDPKPEYKIYPVWFTSVLGNWKALIGTTLPDGMYYEVTYNSAKGEAYLDAYKKVHNTCIKDEVLNGQMSIDD